MLQRHQLDWMLQRWETSQQYGQQLGEEMEFSLQPQRLEVLGGAAEGERLLLLGAREEARQTVVPEQQSEARCAALLAEGVREVCLPPFRLSKMDEMAESLVVVHHLPAASSERLPADDAT